MRRSSLSAIAVLVTVVIFQTAALAQAPLPPEPGRPFGGVFRGNRTEGSTEALSLTVSVSEAYDNDIIGTQSGPGGPAVESGLFSRVSSQLGYSKRMDRLRFTAGAGLGLDYYSNLETDIPQPVDTYQGSAGIIFSTRRAVVQVSQQIGYYPYFGFDLASFGPPLDPGVSLGDTPDLRPGPEAALFESPVITYTTSGSAAFPMGRRSTTTIQYSYAGSKQSADWPTVDGQSGSAQYSHAVNRNVKLLASYAYQFSKYYYPALAASQYTSHDLTGGASWTRALSSTRSVSLSGSAGKSFINDNRVGDFGLKNSITANGSVGFQFARSWTVHADFHRSLQYVQGLTTPYFGNGWNIGLQGEPTRRLELSASTGVVNSDSVAANASGTDYDTRITSIHARYALGANIAIFGEYGLSYYKFGPLADLPSGVLQQYDREVVQVGLTFGHLLFRR